MIQKLNQIQPKQLSNQIIKILPKFNHTQNSRRKQAFLFINQIFHCNHLKFSHLIPIITALPSKFLQKNNQLIKQDIRLITKLYETYKQQMKPYSRALLNSLLQILDKNKQSLQFEITNCIQSIQKGISLNFIIRNLLIHLESEKLNIRIQLLKYLREKILMISDDLFKLLCKGIVFALTDYHKQIKKSAEYLIIKIIDTSSKVKLLRLSIKKYRPGYLEYFNNFLNDSKNFQDQTNKTSLYSNSIRKKSWDVKQQKSIKTNICEIDQILQQINFIKQLSSNHQTFDYQNQIINLIKKSFNPPLAKLMISLNYQYVNQASLKLSNMCKDLQYHDQIRQKYSLILKWIVLKVWGSTRLIVIIIELVPQLLCILQKKNISILQEEIQLIITILRQSFLLIESESNINFKQICAICFKCLIKMKPPIYVLFVLLKQYQVDLKQIHFYLSSSKIQQYKNLLNKIVKDHFLTYVSDPLILNQISNIKQLTDDAQFMKYLYSKFDEEGLNGYGFNRTIDFLNKKSQILKSLKIQIKNIQLQSDLEQLKSIITKQKNQKIKKNQQINKNQQKKKQNEQINDIQRKVQQDLINQTKYQIIIAQLLTAINQETKLKIYSIFIKMIDRYANLNIYTPCFDLLIEYIYSQICHMKSETNKILVSLGFKIIDKIKPNILLNHLTEIYNKNSNDTQFVNLLIKCSNRSINHYFESVNKQNFDELLISTHKLFLKQVGMGYNNQFIYNLLYCIQQNLNSLKSQFKLQIKKHLIHYKYQKKLHKTFVAILLGHIDNQIKNY